MSLTVIKNREDDSLAKGIAKDVVNVTAETAVSYVAVIAIFVAVGHTINIVEKRKAKKANAKSK